MQPTSNLIIPLSDISPDAQPLIRAYRKAEYEGKTATDIPTLRELYSSAAIKYGVKSPEVEQEDFLCPVENGEITLRSYRAPELGDKVTDALIYFHGGGWTAGGLESHEANCRFLANEAKITVIAVDYRLAPEFKFPIPLEDSITALNFICENNRLFKIDPMRIILAGDSAGGQIATILAHQYSEELPAQGEVIAEILFYPSTDLTLSFKSYQRIDRGFPVNGKSVREFRAAYLTGEEDLTDPRLSPLLNNQLNRHLHTFIITVGLDPLVDEGIAYAQKLREERLFVQHYHIPNQPHDFLAYSGLIPTGKEYLKKAAYFIRTLR